MGEGGGFLIGLGVIIVSTAYYLYQKVQETTNYRHLRNRIEERQSKVRLQKENLSWDYNSRLDAQAKCKNYPPPTASTTVEVDKFRSRIISLSSDELLQEVAEGRFSVLQVVQAYKAEAYRVDLKTNCITEFLEEAEEFAKFLDTMDVKGPLHGLPISVKETFNLKCHDCTAGLAKFLGKPCQKDAVLVQVLKKLGAVPFVRTNIAQSTCSFGNANPIYGDTLHPQCSDRIPGGSSCGEGSLIALGGSILGLGTDIGGSVRIPAAMCGIYSLKPTQNRISGVGVKKSIDGITGLHDVPGMMSREVQTLITVFRAITSPVMFDMDARVIPLPFQKELFNVQRPLKIGYYEDDGLILPTPGCRRAVQLAKANLEKMGHELVQFTVPNISKAFDLTINLFAADGGRTLNEMMEGEPISSPMEYIKKTICDRVQEFIQRRQYLKPLTSEVSIPEKSTYELWKMMAEREEYVDLFTQVWRSQNLDAILAPGFAIPAFNSSFVIPLGETIFITMLYNLLNFPVGAVPVCRETEADQMALQQYPDDTPLSRTMKRAAAGAVGMPLGVQIVGLPWQEEMVLRVMKDLETGLKAIATDECSGCPSPTPPIIGSFNAGQASSSSSYQPQSLQHQQQHSLPQQQQQSLPQQPLQSLLQQPLQSLPQQPQMLIQEQFQQQQHQPMQHSLLQHEPLQLQKPQHSKQQQYQHSQHQNQQFHQQGPIPLPRSPGSAPAGQSTPLFPLSQGHHHSTSP